MNYTLMSSLEHRALIRTAITLWNQDDIMTLTTNFYFQSLILSGREKEWQIIEDKVLGKVSKLPLPESLKKKVLDFIKPIGLEILKWRKHHRSFLSERRYFRESLNRLYLTPEGTVDKKKTSEVLIRDENLDIAKCYKLACIYCLENDIRALWTKIPENYRKFLYSEKDPRDVKQHELVVLWTYDIKGEVASMDDMIERRWRKCTPYQYAFEYAAVGGNKVATEYFLQKLTPEEREESLVRTAGNVANRRCVFIMKRTDFPKTDYTDVLCFLLSQINAEQQLEVFKSRPYEVLKCFLDWPFQCFFMETVNRMWDFLSEEDYYCLLGDIIINKVMTGYKDKNNEKLFGEFWQQSPATHKEYVINECASGSLLTKLLQIQDKENIKQILKNATTAQREKIIFSSKGKNTCEKLIYNGTMCLLKFFVQECISSKDIMIKFKEEFKKRIIRHHSKETLDRDKDMWSRFFQLLDDLIQAHDKKRSMEEGNSFPAKRL